MIEKNIPYIHKSLVETLLSDLLEVLDISNSTIIKTSKSIKNGARYLASIQSTTKDACERNCCATDSCNVAVLEQKVI